MFKDVPPKEGKKLKETADKEKFYKVVDGVFYLPPISYLKNNLKELQVLNEAFNAYYKAEDTTGEDWKWENPIEYDRRVKNCSDSILKIKRK